MLPTDKTENFLAEIEGNIKKPEATLTDVVVKNFSREGVDINAKLSVNNPYGYPLPICDFTYELKITGRMIAKGILPPGPGSLKASDTTLLELSVKVPYCIMVSWARDIGGDWGIDYELEVGLTIIDIPVIFRHRIDLSTKGEIKVPRFLPLHPPPPSSIFSDVCCIN